MQAILDQEGGVIAGRAMQKVMKAECIREQRSAHKVSAEQLMEDMPADMQRFMRALSEKGTTAWLTALTLECHGFALHESTFRRRVYVVLSSNQIICSLASMADTLQHNEILDITVSLLEEVCQSVTTEPHLQPFTGEVLADQQTLTTKLR